MNIKQNDKIEREVMVSHQSDLLTQDVILTGIHKYCKFSDYGISFDFPLIKYEHGSGDISYPVWQVEELKRTEFSEKELKKLVYFLENELGLYREFLKKFKDDIRSDVERVGKVRNYFEKTLRGVSTIPYFAFELTLYKKLEEEGVSPKDIPSSITDTSLASLELQQISDKYKNELENKGESISGDLKEVLKKFCERFGYLGMIYFKGNPWTIQEAYRMLLSAKSNEPKEKEEGNLSVHTRIASDLLRLRTQKWELMCQGSSLFRQFIKEFFKDEIVYEELLNLRLEEVLNIVDGKYYIEDPGLGRERFSLEITKNGVIFETTVGEMEDVQVVKETEIKGTTAQSGKAIGTVKIILTPKEGYKLKEGDILVTKMSTPDFLPVMKKAAAFVTDIGGITSHAAIVSREMKKPCIIGTKNATKMLKDGDLVEVDAEKGVVRIIK